MNKKIVVFAGNECVKEKEKYYYSLAYDTGKYLALAGYITVTGGGEGLMNEVLRGAFENKGETIGIQLKMEGRIHSSFITSHILFEKLGPRQDKLLSLADGFLSVPGGVGTLYEILEVIILKKRNEIPKTKPLILIDNYFEVFKILIEKMKADGFVNSDIDKLYTVVPTPQQAIEELKRQMS